MIDPEKLSPEIIFEARKEIGNVTIAENMERYIVDIISATRYPEKYNEEIATWVDYGASPRGTIALDRCSRVNAWMQNRDFVTPDDVQEVIKDVLRHRIALSYKARAEGISVNTVIDKLIQVVAVIG